MRVVPSNPSTDNNDENTELSGLVFSWIHNILVLCDRKYYSFICSLKEIGKSNTNMPRKL